MPRRPIEETHPHILTLNIKGHGPIPLRFDAYTSDDWLNDTADTLRKSPNVSSVRLAYDEDAWHEAHRRATQRHAS